MEMIVEAMMDDVEKASTNLKGYMDKIVKSMSEIKEVTELIEKTEENRYNKQIR